MMLREKGAALGQLEGQKTYLLPPEMLIKSPSANITSLLAWAKGYVCRLFIYYFYYCYYCFTIYLQAFYVAELKRSSKWPNHPSRIQWFWADYIRWLINCEVLRCSHENMEVNIWWIFHILNLIVDLKVFTRLEMTKIIVRTIWTTKMYLNKMCFSLFSLPIHTQTRFWWIKQTDKKM